MKRKETRFSHRIDLVAAIEDCDHRIKMAMKLGEAHGREADRIRALGEFDTVPMAFLEDASVKL